MHIFFSGIGGTGIGPLALIAKQAGFEVSGSDKLGSQYTRYLANHGITDIHIGQSREIIANVHAKKPIDWFVYSSSVAIENPNAPELTFCREKGIKASKRAELLNYILQEKNLKLIAIAGTHGKTTTTAMTIWLFKQLEIPVSYSVGAKLSFGDMGHYEPDSEYFIYEADEFDRNFLEFHPRLSLISGIDWDHPDIYPTREDYYVAFRKFLDQSELAFIWKEDATKLGVNDTEKIGVLDYEDYPGLTHLAGEVNRRNSALVAQGIMTLLFKDDIIELSQILDTFPGVSRRFEQIMPGLYSDYAHTPPKIRGALEMAHEKAGDNVVVVYEGLHNTRQHFIKKELEYIFDRVKKLYVVPSYLAREDKNLPLLSPNDLIELLSSEAKAKAEATGLDQKLKTAKAWRVPKVLLSGNHKKIQEWRQERSQS